MPSQKGTEDSKNNKQLDKEFDDIKGEISKLSEVIPKIEKLEGELELLD